MSYVPRQSHTATGSDACAEMHESSVWPQPPIVVALHVVSGGTASNAGTPRNEEGAHWSTAAATHRQRCVRAPPAEAAHHCQQRSSTSEAEQPDSTHACVNASTVASGQPMRLIQLSYVPLQRKKERAHMHTTTTHPPSGPVTEQKGTSIPATAVHITRVQRHAGSVLVW